MFVRALTPMALAGAFALPAGSAARPAVPLCAGHRAVPHVRGSQDHATAMGQSSETDMSSGQKFTMALARQSADTLAMAVTIDSIAQKWADGTGARHGRSDRQEGQATLSPAGEYYSMNSPGVDSGRRSSSVADQLVHVLPRIRVALANRATWTDTPDATTVAGRPGGQAAGDLGVHRAGDTTVGGTRHGSVRRASTATSGSGQSRDSRRPWTARQRAPEWCCSSHDGTFLGGAGSEDQAEAHAHRRRRRLRHRHQRHDEDRARELAGERPRPARSGRGTRRIRCARSPARSQQPRRITSSPSSRKRRVSPPGSASGSVPRQVRSSRQPRDSSAGPGHGAAAEQVARAAGCSRCSRGAPPAAPPSSTCR